MKLLVCRPWLAILATALLCGGVRLDAGVGANTPFTSYEAEAGLLGGGATVVALTAPPTTRFSSPQLEASGHAYVHLGGTGQYVTLTNNTGKSISALNIRFSIPDSTNGGGISNTIDLYVGGTLRGQIPVNSFQTWVYESAANYNGMSQSPSAGFPHVFWDEVALFVPGGAIPVGTNFTIQVDATNTAPYYDIDVVDLETPTAALGQPANSFSITSYGAQANNPGFDNTSALNNCMAAAQAAGQMVWIPQGTFYANGFGLNASGVTVAGAGPWYSKVVSTGTGWTNGFFFLAHSASFQNLTIDAIHPDSTPGLFAILGYGTSWMISNVWARHTMLTWGTGEGVTVVNSRVNNSWGDGININNVAGTPCGNVLVSNNFVRGNGDDAIAINSTDQTGYDIIGYTVANNTTVASWWANQMGIYGGKNLLIVSNLFLDCVKKQGIEISTYCSTCPSAYLTNLIVRGNTILRGGSYGYAILQAGIGINDSSGGTNILVQGNTITAAMFEAVEIQSVAGLVFESNIINAPGTTGIWVDGGPLGNAVFNYNVVENLNSGQKAFSDNTPYSSFMIGGISNVGFTVPGPLPSPWLSLDIGSVGFAGGSSYNAGAFTIVGSGADIGSASDKFHFTCQPATANCYISAQVAMEEIFNPQAKAGVMIRSSLDPSDMEASVVVTPTNGILFQWRNTYGGPTSSTTVTGLTAPYWVSVARNGNAFTASYSSNGVTWTTLGTPATIAMATNVFLGLPIASHANGFLSSALVQNVSVFAPGPVFPAVHWEGDLIANLQSADLSASSAVWTNRTSNSNSVGNFTAGSGNLSVATLTWGSQSVKALYVNDTVSRAVQSALQAPTGIIGNNPVSAEAWIYATAVNQQNSCAIGYGLQGQSSAPEEDREFNYNTAGGGGVSGDFGSYDTPWATTPAAGAWRYLAWSYDGSMVKLYLDGVLNASNSPSSPLITPGTVIGVGAGLGGGPNLAVDAFQGYIAAARVESGVLTATDIATNYAMGVLSTAAALTPSGLAATAGDSQVVLTWNSPGNATGYNVKRSGSVNGPYTVIATNQAALSFTNTGLSDGTTYYFVVSGLNLAGESTNSAAVAAQPISMIAPQIGGQGSGGQIQITWPQANTGWSLRAQTNTNGAGIGTNWAIVPGSVLTNQMTFPLALTNGSVFFRLTYP